MDSASSYHICNSLDYLSDIYSLDSPIWLTTGAGPVYSELAGSVTIQPYYSNADYELVIHNVYYIPDFPENLLSIGLITSKATTFITFIDGYAVLKRTMLGSQERPEPLRPGGTSGSHPLPCRCCTYGQGGSIPGQERHR